MFPAAGFILWLFLGGLVGFITGKVSSTDGSHGTMANLGVGAVSAVIAGFVTTLVFSGERSNGGYWASIAVAVVVALVAVTAFRALFKGRVPTVR